MYHPTKKEFIKKTKLGNLIPVYKEIIADTQTPVSAYKQVSHGDKFSFILESVERGEQFGRYSFIGTDPEIVFKCKNNKGSIFTKNKEKQVSLSGNPLPFLKHMMAKYRFVADDSLPPFCGGAVGYFSYDVIRFIEKLPMHTADDLNLPDCVLMFTDTIMIFDHLLHKMKIVSNVHLNDKMDPSKAYDQAIQKIDRIIEKLNTPVQKHKNRKQKVKYKLKSNTTKNRFTKIVKKAKEYIKAGDIIQTVLSQRLETGINIDSFDIYRALRIINPSPYMYYLKLDNFEMAGSSPEILVKVENKIVEERPIAGTRPRGKTEIEDKRLVKELLSDPKELAEHIMLVDLSRNDIGRICKYGTVKVGELMGIEKYSHVMHIVSDVQGKIRPDLDSIDVFKACFPAGTVSGAPKIRAMELIEELEPTRRGPYAGAVGYLSFSGDMDTCITIRTAVIKNNTAYLQAGAGIVADSVPDEEYNETLNKAKVLIKAIKLAEEGLI
ncbi:anthranilate synthase component I [bacterium]|nr:anthranilate synthase component I [bacterium]